jgi:hypothetical protein
MAIDNFQPIDLAKVVEVTNKIFNNGPSVGAMDLVADKLLYEPRDANTNRWYQNGGGSYGFRYTPRGKKAKNGYMFMLPINPSNLNITTQFATNIVTTLYGVVEEHSNVRYYDIVIEGTTGFVPKYVSHKSADIQKSMPGRDFFISESLPALGGFLQATMGVANQIKDSFNDIFGGDSKETAGFDYYRSGYLAFHNLYRYFLLYKRDAAGLSNKGLNNAASPRFEHPLSFINLRDKVMYDCVPLSFTLRRSAESPMLYNYSIQIRAYNLRTYIIDKQIATDVLNNLGLKGVKSESAFYKMQKMVKGTANLIGAVSSLGSALGS